MELHKLFGEAIEISLPKDYIKLSEITNCPSHEEVFSNPEQESSITIEILEPIPNQTDQKILECCWEDLLYANEACAAKIIEHKAISSQILSYLKDENITARLILGEQEITKYNGNKEESKLIHIYLFGLHLKKVNALILISLNVPDEYYVRSEEKITENFLSILKSLKIVDWELFQE